MVFLLDCWCSQLLNIAIGHIVLVVMSQFLLVESLFLLGNVQIFVRPLCEGISQCLLVYSPLFEVNIAIFVGQSRSSCLFWDQRAVCVSNFPIFAAETNLSMFLVAPMPLIGWTIKSLNLLRLYTWPVPNFQWLTPVLIRVRQPLSLRLRAG